MYCVTRKNMKFAQYEIPEGTKGYVIGQPDEHIVNAPGVEFKMYILLWDIEHTLVSKPVINNELKNRYSTGSQMTAIVIDTNTKEVYMGIDEDDGFYDNVTLSLFQLKKIFGEDIPKEIDKAEYNDRYMLSSVVNYLESNFTKWVNKNCDFITVTKEDIENGEYHNLEEGYRVLSVLGIRQFEEMKKKYQAKLEAVGFTYDFKGGLNWD
ncbi:hypothetical protein [Clostridium felsineum]|uniref:hypothetical protein n=1 Tax=Clostridium felsineum TaxID=36839 RepID=UPI00098C749E|nr:hypothetical protein [Clostridium felsineum]URZ15452.1 hypothetical protein CLFE_014920 [Clostridium felsineum DSM 794]